ncbi:BTB/POZ domain-containing protein [Glycine max]|nr:BTB/POZ domain-containing protein [Glycine max]
MASMEITVEHSDTLENRVFSFKAKVTDEMRGWNQFETIYEEEREFSSTSSPSLSPSSSSSPPPSLHSIKNSVPLPTLYVFNEIMINSFRSLDSGCEPDVLICVQGTSFRLHKARLISRSSYLKRYLTGVSNLTLSPPLNITAETFAAVAEFCYSRRVHLTPSNVATVRVAAELLGMTGEENLREVTESYFERVVGIDASMVLRSCVALLPESETTASLASRCIEALVWEDDVSCLNDVVGYIFALENKYGKLTEEQKSEICNSIDCSRLSSHTLVDCVQNPRMPLRFIVRAILMEHLNTRRSVTAAARAPATTGAQQQPERTSLREILQRDTADRETTQIKETMDSTYSRIQSLERELRGMKKILHEHHQAEDDTRNNNNVLNSERFASFHFVPADAESSKIQRGGRGSVSSSGFVLDNVRRKNKEVAGGMCNLSVGSSCHDDSKTPKMTKFLRHSKLITGLKHAFRISKSTSNTTEET